MQLSSLKQKHFNSNFKGKAPDVDTPKKIKKFVNCGIDNLADNLTKEVKAKAPKSIESIDGFEIPKKVGFLKNAVEGVRDLFELPFDLFDEIATRFRGSRIDNSKFCQNIAHTR